MNEAIEPIITRQLAIYDPRHLPEADFLSNFVGRKGELAHLLKQIKASAGENKRHLLIFGARGMGKTSMLRRIAISIRDDATLSRQWIPVNFREEQYNVRQLSFFWCNTADAVAEWCEQVGDHANAARLDDVQESAADADALWALLNQVSQQHNARLLLLVDNLNLILENLSEQDQWALRHTLSQPDGPMMIAATPTLISELTRRVAPFYDYFQLHDLLPLSASELRVCLLDIAATRGAAGQRVSTEINQQPERLQVLHNLTNGNPRTLFHIYQMLESLNPNNDKTPGAFMALLESLLDSVTPLYKARTEELTQQQRQVLDAIALAWDPKSTAWIAKRTQLASTTLSPQLKRLRELGVIEDVSLADNKKGVQLRERFYNIWYLLRNGSRRGRQRLRFFTCFLVDWYSTAERQKLARNYLRTKNKPQLEYSLALASAMDHRGLRRALVQNATMDAFARNELLDGIFDKELDSAIMDRKQQQQDVDAGLKKKAWKPNKIRQFWRLLSGSLTLREKERQKIVNAIKGMNQQQLLDLLDHWEEQTIPNEIFLTPALIDDIREKLQAGLIRDYEDIEGFLAVSEQTGNDALLLFPLVLAPEKALQAIPETQIALVLEGLFRSSIQNANADYWDDLGDLADVLFQYDIAEQAYRKAIALDPQFAYPWDGLGSLLQTHFCRYDEAEQAYRKAIELDPQLAYLWVRLGSLLQTHFCRYDEAEQAYRKAIELDPQDAYPWDGLGSLLQTHLCRYDEAEQAYRKAIELDPQLAYPWNALGRLLQTHFCRYDEAEQAYRKAIELDPQLAYPWNGLGSLLQTHFCRYDEAEQAYRKAIELDPQGAYAWNGLGNVLQDHFCRYNEAEKAYLKSEVLLETADIILPNLCWLAIQQDQRDKALTLYKRLDNWQDIGRDLLTSAITIAQDNFGGAWVILQAALNKQDPELWTIFRDDLLRLVRLFLAQQYGARLLEAMKKAGCDQTVAAFYHAVEASVGGEALLKNVNPEVHKPAESMFRWIISIPQSE